MTKSSQVSIRWYCFNSTMVRLKACIRLFQYDRRQSFNSTMVRLKADGLIKIDTPYACFNSTMVRLKAKNQTYTITLITSFNSTMVRLKVDGNIFTDGDLKMFQFHNGSIKRGISMKMRKKQTHVSIPQWFD